MSSIPQLEMPYMNQHSPASFRSASPIASQAKALARSSPGQHRRQQPTKSSMRVEEWGISPVAGILGFAMATRWLYEPSGNPAYYVDGDAVYTANGKPEFFISNGWVCRYQDGAPAYWISDNWLYEHPSGKPAFYFG